MIIVLLVDILKVTIFEFYTLFGTVSSTEIKNLRAQLRFILDYQILSVLKELFCPNPKNYVHKLVRQNYKLRPSVLSMHIFFTLH